jgi:hypothetical protein
MAVKSGGAPSPRPFPKRPGGLNRNLTKVLRRGAGFRRTLPHPRRVLLCFRNTRKPCHVAIADERHKPHVSDGSCELRTVNMIPARLFIQPISLFCGLRVVSSSRDFKSEGGDTIMTYHHHQHACSAFPWLTSEPRNVHCTKNKQVRGFCVWFSNVLQCHSLTTQSQP